MEHPTLRAISREALIEQTLRAVLRILATMASSPRVRVLRTKARFYALAVAHWTAVPPTVEQVGAMLDMVTELHSNVLAEDLGRYD